MASAQNSNQFLWDTNATTVAGGNGAGPALNQLNFPYAIFIDSNNALYVTDTQNHRIQKWTEGATEGITVAGGNGAGAEQNQLNTPTAIWVDGSKNVYVMDSFNARIQKWAPNALQGTTVAGGNGEGSEMNQFNKPGGFYFKNNSFYVVDAGNNRIVRWTLGDNEASFMAAGTYGTNADQLGNPSTNGSIYVDDNENLYVTDYTNNRVQKFVSGSTQAITVAGGNGSGTNDNQTKSPVAIQILNDGRMLIAEYTGRRINMWVEGATEGTVVAGGNGSGSASNQFKSPRGIFVAANGDLYVSDMANHRVQKFSRILENPFCTDDLGGASEPAFVTFKINETTFNHNTYAEPTTYYHTYPQNTNTTATLIKGEGYSFYTFTSSEAVVGMWIDFNQNNLFETEEYTELVNNMNAQNTTGFEIPEDAIAGITTMRVRTRAYGSSILNSDVCTTFGSGETRDYYLTIGESLDNNHFDTTAFTYYPNPVNSVLNINYNEKITDVSFFNLLGQNLLTKTINGDKGQFDLSNFQTGTYIMQINTETTASSFKILKK